MRSGQGTKEMIAARIKLFEESDTLDELEAKKQFTTDFGIQEKMYQRYLRKQQKGIEEDSDDYLEIEINVPNKSVGRSLKMMHGPNKQRINKLVEPYPT